MAAFEDYHVSLSAHNNERGVAEEMIPLLGKLYRANTVVCTVFGEGLMNESVIGVLKRHRAVRHMIPDVPTGLTVMQTMPIVQALSELGAELGPCNIDIGKLAIQYTSDGGDLADKDAIMAFVSSMVAPALGALEEPAADGTVSPRTPKGRDVVLYGFGRIGRLVARILIEKAGAGNLLALRAVVVRPHGDPTADLKKRASLLRRDSTHGKFHGMILVDEDNLALIANGVRIQFIYAAKPSDIDYTVYGIDNAILIDNTGIWREREGLSVHAERPGIAKAVLTAPGKGDVPNIVVGVNSAGMDISDNVYATASCTTNAVCPPLKVLNEALGVVSLHIETIHAFTNDQNLLDNFHKKARRGRAAPLNLVLTETGAAKAVANALPEMAGKITGSAIRCPVPDVSMAILILEVERETSVEEVNDILRTACIEGPLQRQIAFSTSTEAVSTDMLGSRETVTIDAPSTIVHGKRVHVYCWYDNEAGFSRQVVRLAQILAEINHVVIPSDIQ